MPNLAYLLLGSNEGDSRGWLNKAIALLEKNAGVVTQKSSLYQTAAWGKEDQPDFLNMAVSLETDLAPKNLLHVILQAEEELGRYRVEKWGPRIIDIDILFYNNDIVKEPHLTIPHPYVQDRRFALEPMNEIAPHLVHPVFKTSIKELLAKCPDKLHVTKLLTHS